MVRRILIAVLCLGFAACTQNVTPGGGGDGQTLPGTGLAWEDGVPNTIRVVYGNDAGTAVEGSRAQELEDRLTDLENTLANFGGSKYLGQINSQGNGATYTFNGKTGVPALIDACVQIYGDNSHPCTIQEIQNNYLLGQIPTTDTGWVLVTNTHPFNTPTVAPKGSSKTATCKGFTYNTADEAWGTVFQTEFLQAKLGGSYTGNPTSPILTFSEMACSSNISWSCCGPGTT